MSPLPGRRRHPVAGQHVVIVGGSEGIGLAAATEVARRGGSVTIVARRSEPLAAAAATVSRHATGSSQVVETIAVDARDEAAVDTAFGDLVERRGIPDVLVNNVGYADPRYVEEYTAQDFRDSLETNVMGQVTPTLALLPHLLRAGRGHVVNVSSMLGYFAIMGYAAYAPSKFAVVGFSEALRHELRPRGITVGVLYPPDTLTPGYERENVHKPPECLAMSEGSKTLTAAQVARALVDGIETRAAHILPGDAGMVWRVQRYAPGVLRLILDRQYVKARATSGERRSG